MQQSEDEIKFEELIQVESLDGYSVEEAIQIIGKIQDLSYERNFLDGMNHTLKLTDTIKDRTFSNLYSAYYHYTVSNIWFDRYKLLNPKEAAWKWECGDYNQVIIHLRTALRDINSLSLLEEGEKDLYCQINTNLANLLSYLGRIIEAIEYWKNALAAKKDFGMALGNLGHGYKWYANIVYDSGHKEVFLKHSYKHLKESLSNDLTDEAETGFESLIDDFENKFDKSFLNDREDYNKWGLGETKEEIEYRKWCLQHNLFINPLNDLGNHTIAARDILHVPDIVTKIDEQPFHHGMFNVIKQEFVAARYLLYESIIHAKQREVHFADKDNLMVETLDYSFHSIGFEKMKLAFRMAYSIFDKIAFFINAYFRLGIRHRQVNFRTIWYNNRRKENGIRQEFDNYENWPLRGLFWLSKDLFEEDDEFKNCLEPDAREIHNIRNHLEHKYLKVHMFGTEEAPPFSSDHLSYSISRDSLFEKTLRILKLSRAAIMYLSFSVHREELLRRENMDPSKIAPIPTTELFDNLRH